MFAYQLLYDLVCPPSTTNIEPVANEDFCEHRNATKLAISSGFPNRCIGTSFFNIFSTPRGFSANFFAQTELSKIILPGTTAFILIPSFANGLEIFLISHEFSIIGDKLKASAVIQTRMGSNRFPGKVMVKLNEENKVLDYVINQLRFCKSIKNLIIATTYLEQDDVIVEYAKENNLEYFRGEPLDVLDRFYKCAKEFSLETIVRMNSDSPFLDPILVDEVVNKFQENDFDFVSNNLTRTYPIGIDTEVFSFNTLEKAWKEAKLPSEREHVTPFMKKNNKIFKIYNLENNQKIPIYRLTIDRNEDLEFLRAIASNITKQPILMEDIYELFLQKPEILDLCNDKMSPVEGYSKSLKDDEEFLKK